jgi:hypothetical protein
MEISIRGRFLLMGGLLLVAAALLLLVSITPAANANGSGNCATGNVCVWAGNGYNGCWKDMEFKQDNYQQLLYEQPCDGTSLHDTINSVKNRGNCGVTMWRDTNFNGPWIRFRSGDAGTDNQDSNLSDGADAQDAGGGGTLGGDWHDRLDSHKFCT